MISKKSILILTSLSTLGLAACHGSVESRMNEAKYWQRQSSSSALYLQGPKAQQMLHQNIAECVGEIAELERLGEIRRAIPANYNSGNTIENRTASQRQLDDWDSPERDGYLYNEHLDYHDFETCMNAKGWERAEFLPYTEADMARQEYLNRHGKVKKRTYRDRENVTSLHTASQNPAPYKDLND